MDTREVFHQIAERVLGQHPGWAILERANPIVKARLAEWNRSFREAPVAIVLTIDAEHVKLVGQHLDFALEVDCRKPAVAQRAWQGIGRRCELHPGVGEFTHQAGHQDRVPRIVELELVDADQRVPAERLNRPPEGQGPDEVCVLDERAERFFAGRRVPKGRQEVSFADAEAAVEVDPGPCWCLLRAEQFAQSCGFGLVDHVGKLGQGFHRRRLRRLAGVRAVTVKGHVAESWGRIEPGQKLID